MTVSGFTVVRNAVQYDYPVLEAIHSVLPICDEFVVGVGHSDDDTLNLIRSIDSPKIKIFETRWDLTLGPEVLSVETNKALAQCSGDWAFYIQADEMIHEDDLPHLRRLMEQHRDNANVDALRFKYLHFYGSYYRYRIDKGWYQKQDRIIRNNGEIASYGDAFAFHRHDGKPLRSLKTGVLMYHYGWVHTGDIVTKRRSNHQDLGFTGLEGLDRDKSYEFGDLNRFPAYFGTHPVIMTERIRRHAMSRDDKAAIDRRYWWHPGHMFRLRYKTCRREKRELGR